MKYLIFNFLHIRKAVFIIIAAVCWSCDIYAEYSLSIDNQTRDTIKIFFLESSSFKFSCPDTLIFPPLDKIKFFWVMSDAGRGGCGYTRIRKDDVIIYSTSGKKIEKAIWNHDNWNCNGSFWNGWHMTFVIKEDDLE